MNAQETQVSRLLSAWVKEARDHYDQACKYALTATSKTRKARYALDAASHNKSNRPTK